MARKLGVDLAKVQGSGPGGRVLIDDLTTFLRVATGQATKSPAVEINFGVPGTRVKLQGLRRLIAEHMVHAKQTIPHYTYVDEMDVTDLVKTRDGLRAASPEGVKITYMPFFVKAVVHALKEVPLVNAALDDAAGEIVLHDHYHIGVAVATPAGLIVPVVRDADKLSLTDCAREIERLTSAARAGKSKREDLQAGTFTITSIGNIGGLFATPIIHHPQVGILGVGRIVKRPVFDNQMQVRAADMVYLSFSFDHRVVDGAVGTAFGNAVIRRLRNPVGLVVSDG
jgi:pyruvate dehydrogenase E2 component (dihydrolipoamide acetyltransferase)/2-oxoisovalerate dehydrogenase E2 component (dihydrolipoyl transacylase)